MDKYLKEPILAKETREESTEEEPASDVCKTLESKMETVGLGEKADMSYCLCKEEGHAEGQASLDADIGEGKVRGGISKVKVAVGDTTVDMGMEVETTIGLRSGTVSFCHTLCTVKDRGLADQLGLR